MGYYVYIIQSELDASFYKGFSENPLKRLQQHNNKEAKFTSSKTPWKLVYIELLESKCAALIREKAVKKYGHERIGVLINSPKNILPQFIQN